jgi:signal transduction histidine kinase
LHYFLVIVPVENILLLAVVMLCIVTLAGVMISKLAIDPLQEHVTNLQNLSKETLHELNLPISTIKTNLHMLKKHIEDEKDVKRMQRIESACGMLAQRYHELDYMIKKQTLVTIKEDFDVAKLVEERINFLQSVYPHSVFSVTLQETHITNDKIGLAKAIDNIIDNGIKYSPKNNKIHINLTNNTLSIQDFGCGMDEVELLRIFDNYYQSNKNMQGFGIGLGMVKRFCDRNEITLNFKSKKDEGTTVTFKFKSQKE